MRDVNTAAAIKNDLKKRAYFLMTNIRLVLVKFVIDANFNPNPTLQRSYYFTVQDWDVSAACFCNGQAANCNAKVTEGLLRNSQGAANDTNTVLVLLLSLLLLLLLLLSSLLFFSIFFSIFYYFIFLARQENIYHRHAYI